MVVGSPMSDCPKSASTTATFKPRSKRARARQVQKVVFPVSTAPTTITTKGRLGVSRIASIACCHSLVMTIHLTRRQDCVCVERKVQDGRLTSTIGGHGSCCAEKFSQFFSATVDLFSHGFGKVSKSGWFVTILGPVGSIALKSCSSLTQAICT